MKRFEYKYLVPLEQLDDLRNAIKPFVEVDPYMDSVADYCVHSIYYDTSDLNCYYEKLAGIQHRKKIRIRGYNKQSDNSLIFLEIKRKDDALVSKNRAPLFFRDLNSLFVSKDINRFVKNGNGKSYVFDDARRFFFHVERYVMQPIVLIHYDREAYFQTDNKLIRITFDKNLRSTPFPRSGNLYRDENCCRSLHGYCVLEVKFPDLLTGPPAWMQDILYTFDLRRTSVSKYTISLDELAIPKRPRTYVFSRAELINLS